MASYSITQELLTKIINVQTEYDPVWTQKAVVATLSTMSEGPEEALLVLVADNRRAKALLDDFIRTGALGDKAGFIRATDEMHCRAAMTWAELCLGEGGSSASRPTNKALLSTYIRLRLRCRSRGAQGQCGRHATHQHVKSAVGVQAAYCTTPVWRSLASLPSSFAWLTPAL